MIYERFENIKIGDGFEAALCTITESCIMQFAGVTDDHNEIHKSDLYARKTRYGQRISHGLLR